MVVVAVPGGLGDLGQQIVKCLVATKKHDVIILSRQGGQRKNGPEHVEVVEVDYSSVESMTSLLDDKKVHTVVSALGVHHEAASNNQVNLIKAADASKSVKRFMPSEFHVDYSPNNEGLIWPLKETSLHNRDVLEQTTDLEYTYVYTGMFMDYFAMPNIPTPIQKLYHIINIPAKTAVIPGNGNHKIAYTHTEDVGKFVATALDLPRWEASYSIIGELTTHNEIVAAAETVTGQKFNKTYDPMEMLMAGKATVLPGAEEIYKLWGSSLEEVIALSAAQFASMVNGAYDVSKQGKSLNELFPHIEAIRVGDYLRECFFRPASP